MTVMFKPVPLTTDYSLRCSISIAGGSGTGKTYSACLLARGLAGGKPFAFIDTENKRALHYHQTFPEMQHYNFGPSQDGDLLGFPPERWIALLDQIEQTEVEAIVIDSFSHAWEGIGGVLEMHQSELTAMVERAQEKAKGQYAVQPDRYSQQAWAQVKPRYRRLIERIVQSRCHVVICIRAKPVIQERDRNTKQMKNMRQTKIRREDLPWDIASDRDLIFEMTVATIMTPERPGQPEILKCPDHFLGVFGSNNRISEQTGTAMREWAETGGGANEIKEITDQADAEARKGRVAFTAFWKKLSKEQREPLSPRLHHYEELCDEADRDDELPFGDGDTHRETESADYDADGVEQGEREREKAERNAKAALAGQIS